MLLMAVIGLSVLRAAQESAPHTRIPYDAEKLAAKPRSAVHSEPIISAADVDREHAGPAVRLLRASCRFPRTADCRARYGIVRWSRRVAIEAISYALLDRLHPLKTPQRQHQRDVQHQRHQKEFEESTRSPRLLFAARSPLLSDRCRQPIDNPVARAPTPRTRTVDVLGSLSGDLHINSGPPSSPPTQPATSGAIRDDEVRERVADRPGALSFLDRPRRRT